MSNTKKTIDMPDLSERDVELLICALRSAEGGFPKIDNHKLAEMAGFKNGNSAAVSFTGVRRKVMGEAGSAKPSPVGKRKQSALVDKSEESPTKKVKAASKKTAKKEQQAKEEVGEDESAAFI